MGIDHQKCESVRRKVEGDKLNRGGLEVDEQRPIGFAVRSNSVPVAAFIASSAAHSRAAEDDNPAPTGTSLVTDITPPTTGCPASASAHRAPAGYADQPSRSPGRISVEKDTAPFSRSLDTVTESDPSGSNRTVVHRSSAMGNAKPRL